MTGKTPDFEIVSSTLSAERAKGLPDCPACFAFDGMTADGTAQTPLPESHEKYVYAVRRLAACVMVQGALNVVNKNFWQSFCQEHKMLQRIVVDQFCTDMDLPKEKMYGHFGLTMPVQE